jgi:hypothetical protein
MKRLRCVIIILLGTAGCGQPLPPPADPELARASLRAALEVWKDGGTVESLRARSPVIYFNDSEWGPGRRLIKYEIVSEQPSGLSWRSEVLLTVASGERGATPHKARYVVDTHPAIVIVREP